MNGSCVDPITTGRQESFYPAKKITMQKKKNKKILEKGSPPLHKARKHERKAAATVGATCVHVTANQNSPRHVVSPASPFPSKNPLWPNPLNTRVFPSPSSNLPKVPTSRAPANRLLRLRFSAESHVAIAHRCAGTVSLRNAAVDPDDGDGDRPAVAVAVAVAAADGGGGGGGAGVFVRQLGASPRRREHPLASEDDASRGVQAAGERRLLQMVSAFRVR